jgi:hypothetical protein
MIYYAYNTRRVHEALHHSIISLQPRKDQALLPARQRPIVPPTFYNPRFLPCGNMASVRSLHSLLLNTSDLYFCSGLWQESALITSYSIVIEMVG